MILDYRQKLTGSGKKIEQGNLYELGYEVMKKKTSPKDRFPYELNAITRCRYNSHEDAITRG